MIRAQSPGDPGGACQEAKEIDSTPRFPIEVNHPRWHAQRSRAGGLPVAEVSDIGPVRNAPGGGEEDQRRQRTRR